MVPIRYNVRSLAVRKVTTLATAVGIALVVWVFGAALMVGDSVKQAMSTSGSPGYAIVLRNGSDAELSSRLEASAVGLVAGQPELASATETTPAAIGETVIVITAEFTDGSGMSNVTVRGMPDTGMSFRPKAKLVRGRLPRPGTGEVIVGKGIAGRYKGLAIGQSFELGKNRPLEVVGVFSAGGSSYEAEVWGDVATLNQWTGRDNSVSSIRVRLAAPSKLASFKATLEADKRAGMKVMGEPEFYDKQSSGMSMILTVMVMIFAFLFSLAAMIGAAITMNSAVANRSREIGTLRALGFSRISILISFVLEAMMLALIGGLVGLLLIVLTTLKTFTMMNFATFSEVVLHFRATPDVIIASLVVSIVMGLIGGLIPAIRAARVSPIEAMRG
jgi:putative ABC transport system permease protein